MRRRGWQWKSCTATNPLTILIGAIMFCGCANDARRAPASVYARADAFRHANNLPSALEVSQRAFSAWRQSPAATWHWKFRLLTAEVLLSEGQTAQALSLLQDGPPHNLDGRDQIEARLLTDRGYAAFVNRQFGEANQYFDQANEIAKQPSGRDEFLRIQVFRAILHVRVGEADRAEVELRAALSGPERDRYVETAAQVEMSHVLLNRHRYDESIGWCRRALETSTREGYYGWQALCLNNLGWCYYRLGDLDKAESYMGQAEALLGRLGKWSDQQTALGNIGTVRHYQGDYKGALVYYRRALALAEKFQFESSQAIWLNNLAMTYIDLGDPASAEAYNRQALDLQSRLKDPALSAWPVLNAAQIALARHDYPAARQAYQNALQAASNEPNLQWEIHGGLAGLYSAEKDPAHARAEYGQAIGILDASWSELLNDQSKLTFPIRAMRFYRRYVNFLMDGGKEQEALDFVESRRARLLAEDMGVKLGAASPRGYRSLAKETGAVLLSYWLGPEQSYLWITAPGGSRAVKLPPEGRIKDLVDRYSKAIQDGRDTAATGNPAGKELFSILVAPAKDLLPPGSRVILVPDGCLHGLNFETLITDSGRYWIEEATVEIAPSLRLLGHSRPPAHANQSILVIGDPVQSDTSLALLPYARREIADISTLFRNPKVLQREDARPEAYRSADPGHFSVVHFAAHAVPNRESPLDSAIVLSGQDSYKLYAWEVSKIPLTADLVTVSACQSAGARAYAGEGLVGFAWAFLNAGARNVVASLWDVNDESTAAFMKSLYENVRRNKPPASALRDVKLAFINSGTVRRKPYYWAPFQVYLGSASR